MLNLYHGLTKGSFALDNTKWKWVGGERRRTKVVNSADIGSYMFYVVDSSIKLDRENLFRQFMRNRYRFKFMHTSNSKRHFYFDNNVDDFKNRHIHILFLIVGKSFRFFISKCASHLYHSLLSSITANYVKKKTSTLLRHAPPLTVARWTPYLYRTFITYHVVSLYLT